MKTIAIAISVWISLCVSFAQSPTPVNPVNNFQQKAEHLKTVITDTKSPSLVIRQAKIDYLEAYAAISDATIQLDLLLLARADLAATKWDARENKKLSDMAAAILTADQIVTLTLMSEKRSQAKSYGPSSTVGQSTITVSSGYGQSSAVKNLHLTEQKLDKDGQQLYLRWFSSSLPDGGRCQVYVQKNGSILALANDDRYQGDKYLDESITIWMDRNGPQIKTEHSISIISKDGASSSNYLGPKHAFLWDNCREAVNRDVPVDVKAKFYGFLGVK